MAPLKISLGFSISFFVLLVGLLLRQCIALKISGYVKQIKDYFANAQLEKELVKSNGSVKLATRKFTEKELEEATSKYDDSRTIATGEHGKVYKGILPDKRVVAVKEFKSESRFRTEFEVLSRIKHRHVVRLLGYCIDSRQHTLVYDFINNDTLYKHIQEKNEGSSTLSFELRMKIAAEIAAALAYMHSSTCNSQIIHLNVNSKRILLDENYMARLAYFREAKFVLQGTTHVEGTVRGSSGYLDPESIQSNTLSEKNDVYSFGVVLVELLTSQNAFCKERPEADKHLASLFLRSVEESRLDQILDGEITRGKILLGQPKKLLIWQNAV
ncbi:PREDICTED: wall-associated receptor kinase 3-like [Prunus mume]|uniref:Wall-associated receptor kinase 3-like n=1 Tax=Prunus mume TaxID=102107 RepID=A0ABM0P2L7_PRUMU|nr:PREDICTED: wall-associated receptor kinase 3-like [Prunus mume]